VKLGIEAGDRAEILEGLSEGDSVVVSAQFLLDSEVSLRAALRRMTAPAPAPAQAAGIKVEGVINAVDLPGHKLNLNHAPIPALGWPAMTMDFSVAEAVSLKDLAPGMKVEFDLLQRDPVTYEITAVRVAGGGGK
jgi:Cu(I)/Ag(I) efflux system membrane fusion protein